MERRMFLKTQQAADELYLHPDTYRKYVNEGRIIAKLIGRNLLTTHDDLLAYYHAEKPHHLSRMDMAHTDQQ
ncbi:MAG: hypothetical protein AAGG68_14840 [Bacteroidota bacterium]